MSVGDPHDVGHTGEFAVTRFRRRPKKHVPVDLTAAVSIAVLTEDSALADAIHDAAAANHPVATASTPDEAVELATHGRCSILITDQISNQQALQLTTQRLRKAQPALVVVAIGCAADQNGLISLLSAGLVDRLMLKPVTPALAQIVLKSAVQQHRTLQGAGAATVMEPQRAQQEPAVVLVELERNAVANDLTEVRPRPQPSPAEVVAPASTVAPAVTSWRIDIPRPPWFAVVAALLAVAGLMLWVAADREPAIDPQAVIASNLAAGQRALNEGHALEPRGRSALDHYTTVLALDPANVAARQGIDQIADRFVAQAGVAIARGEVAAAIVALDSIRRVRPEHRQLRELQEQLDAAQATHAAKAPAPVAATSQPTPKATPASTQSQQKLEAQARAVAEAAEALKRDQLKLADAQQQFALKIEAAQAQLAAARKESAEPAAPAGAAAVAPAVAAPEPASPRLIRIVKPEYPQDALLKGAEGWVNVSMLITPAGNVQDPRIEETSNGSLFNRAAISAVRKWKYEPFVAAEPLEKRRVTVRVDFRMEER
jgi:periplasmic protein TonB